MNIEKTKKMKNNKYKIFFSDGSDLTTYGDVILSNKLLSKKELSNIDINNIYCDTKYYDEYNYIVNFISYKLRSEKEISYKLKNSINKKKIIDDLKKYNLINDDVFLKAFVADKYNLSNDGEYKIMNSLLKHNIDKLEIEEEVSKYDFYSKGVKLANKKAKTIRKSKSLAYNKLYSYLSYLGYKNIGDIISNIELKSNIEQDANKIYNALKDKYQGNDLIYNFANKLYRKGYTKDEIEEYKKRII